MGGDVSNYLHSYTANIASQQVDKTSYFASFLFLIYALKYIYIQHMHIYILSMVDTFYICMQLHYVAKGRRFPSLHNQGAPTETEQCSRNLQDEAKSETNDNRNGPFNLVVVTCTEYLPPHLFYIV